MAWKRSRVQIPSGPFSDLMIEKRIEFFNRVRDIPYKIPLSTSEPDYCCSGKHKILFDLLKSLDLKVRYRVCEFLWNQFDLPEDVKNIPHEENCTHTYLEAYIPENNKWIIVDATWDKGLSDKFMINEWDGMNDTKNAIQPSKIYSPEESEKFVRTESKEDTEKDLEINGKFYDAFNKWLESLRRK